MGAALAHADVFRAIADPTRRAILDQLLGGELPAGAIAERFNVTLSAVSQHLRVLLDAGVVQQRKVGRQRLYTLQPEPLKEVADWVVHYERFWQQKLDALGAYLDKQARSERKR